MTVMILYATIEGQTGKIARFVADEVRKAGETPVLADAEDGLIELSLEGVDRVILAAPVHERRHPQGFEVLVSGRRDELAARPTLMLSVSLNAAFPEGREEAAEYLEEMKMRTGFTPDREMLVAGAVRTGHYDYFARQVVRHVVLRDRDVDAEGEHEFTDWPAIAREVGAFLAAPAPAG